MIPPDLVRKAEYIVDTSGMVDTYNTLRRTSRRGRPTDIGLQRAFFIGMFLSIHTARTATIISIHRLLTTDLCVSDKVRIGVTRDGNDIKYEAFVTFSKSFNNKLGYGKGSVDIADNEQVARHEVVIKVNNDLLDVFAIACASNWFAIDATGLWSWGRGRSKKFEDRQALNVEPNDEDDDDPDEKFVEINRDEDDLPGTSDPDASWWIKTAKAGGKEYFFGYQEHTLVQVPAEGDVSSTEPRLIRRLEVTTANEDVVAVSLRLIDSLNGQVQHLLEDRLYSYKTFERWHKPLNNRGVAQYFDMQPPRKGSKPVFKELERMRFASGRAHCPSTPDELGELMRPGLTASASQRSAFTDNIALRHKYAMYITDQPNEKGTMRVMCPALYGSVGCRLRPGTVPAAILEGKPIVTDPPVATAEGLPACCTQIKVSITPPTKIRKLHQRLYWGSKKWETAYNARTYVEGSYGNRKNSATENLGRGLTRGMGIAWINLIAAMTGASYNLRMLNNWHEDTGLGDPDHPLLQTVAHPGNFEFLVPEVDSGSTAA